MRDLGVDFGSMTRTKFVSVGIRMPYLSDQQPHRGDNQQCHIAQSAQPRHDEHSRTHGKHDIDTSIILHQANLRLKSSLWLDLNSLLSVSPWASSSLRLSAAPPIAVAYSVDPGWWEPSLLAP